VCGLLLSLNDVKLPRRGGLPSTRARTTLTEVPYEPERHGPRRIVGQGFHAAVWRVVRTIPAGAVASYGDVAHALGSRNVARHVGWALAALPEGSDVPWWRVVDGKGKVARFGSASARMQRARLRAEGVEVTREGRVVEFALVRWVTRAARAEREVAALRAAPRHGRTEGRKGKTKPASSLSDGTP
jgi:methylated-DNA-protein-cysteine methyltransferase-like protein